MVQIAQHYSPLQLPPREDPNKLFPVNISKGWMPDYPPYAIPEGGLTICENLLPLIEAYYPALTATAYSTGGVSGTPLSGIELFSNDGDYYVFVGTSTKLYRLATDKSWTDITRASGGDYTGGGTTRWYWDVYGENVIATNFTDSVQILSSMTGANFAALGGSPPKAKFCLQFYGHLILAYLDDGTVYPKRLIWSGLDNLSTWVQSLTTGSDSQNIADASTNITGLARAGNYMVIFHRDSLSVGWYSGARYTFSFAFNKFSGIGATEGSIITVGGNVYFFDERNIYRFDGEANPVPIGDGVRKTFLDHLDLDNLHRITTGHDVRNNLIYWCCPSTSSDGTPDMMLIYNYQVGKYSIVRTSQHCVLVIHKLVLGTDSDEVDAAYPSADAADIDMDSNLLFDNSPLFSCITTDGKLSLFIGTPLTGTLETGEININDDILFVSRVRPKVYNATSAITVNLGTRMNENGTVDYTSNASVGSDGRANTRASGRFSRVKLTTGSHSGITGMNIEGRIIARR